MKLTPARRHGLEVFASHESVFRSNETNLEVGYVYWQTVDWLADNGYAESVPGTGNYKFVLTKKGRELAAAEGLS